MRLFVAIYPPKEVLDHVRDTLRQLDKEKRNIIPVPLDQIHFTLRFVGLNTSISSKQKLAKELLKFSGNYPKPMLNLGKFSLGFPGQHHPRAMFFDLEDIDPLEDLVNVVHKRIREVGAKDTILWKDRDDRDFHITIARLKQSSVTNSGIHRVKELIETVKMPAPPSFVPTEMYLVQSDVPRVGGPVYKRLERIVL